MSKIKHWTADETADFASAYGDGRKFRALCANYGRSEKAARLHLQKLGIVITIERKRGGRPKRIDEPPVIAVEVAQPAGEPAPRGDVAGGCRWIVGPHALRLFCGAAVTAVGSSWCAAHYTRVFQRVPAWAAKRQAEVVRAGERVEAAE